MYTYLYLYTRNMIPVHVHSALFLHPSNLYPSNFPLVPSSHSQDGKETKDRNLISPPLQQESIPDPVQTLGLPHKARPAPPRRRRAARARGGTMAAQPLAARDAPPPRPGRVWHHAAGPGPPEGAERVVATHAKASGWRWRGDQGRWRG